MVKLSALFQDTYVKIRKKQQPGVNGTSTMPKWRFYRLLQFLDSNEKIAKSYNFEKEMAEFQQEQRKSNKASASSSSSSLTSAPVNTNTSINSNQFNNTATISNGVIGTKPVSHPLPPQMILNTNIIPPPTTLPSTTQYTQPNRLKRAHTSQLTYVRQVAPVQLQPSNHVLNVEEPILISQNSAKEPRLSAPSLTNGVVTNGTTPQCEDEFTIFCTQLSIFNKF